MGNPIEVQVVGGVRYERRHVKCGKDNCTKCPHGPYWYAIVQLQNNKTITRYIGKTLGDKK